MTVTISYCGVNSESRIWGIITDDQDMATIYRHVFWGKRDGKLLFQRVRVGRVFQKSRYKKCKIYAPCPELHEPVLEEYNQYKMIRKLKGVF